MQAEDFYLFGAIFERMGDDVTARECWQQGLRLDPGHPEIIAGFARFFVRTKQLARAATFAKELATRPGWEARGDLVLGSIEGERDEPARAAEALGRALSRDPSAAGAPESPSNYRRLLARSLLRIGKAAEAVPALRAVLASGPDPETSWLLSRAYLQSGRLAEAAVALKESGDYRERHETAFEPSPALGAAALRRVPSGDLQVRAGQPPRPDFLARRRTRQAAHDRRPGFRPGPARDSI